MVSPRKNAPDIVKRVWAWISRNSSVSERAAKEWLNRQRTEPRSTRRSVSEPETEADSEDPEEKELYGAFQLTIDQLKTVVDHYEDSLDDIRANISATKSEIEQLNDQRKKMKKQGRDSKARDKLVDIQMEMDALNTFEDERDTVEAKLQNFKKELHEAEKKRRQKQRRDKEPVDYVDDYERSQVERQNSADRKREQKEQQHIRHHQGELGQVVDPENADLSGAQEIVGDEDAQELAEAMNEEFSWRPDPDTEEQRTESELDDDPREEEPWEEFE